MRRVLILLVLIQLAGCANGSEAHPTVAPAPPQTPTVSPTLTLRTATAIPSPTLSPTPLITAPAPGQVALVPILMYHHLKDLPANASELDRTWTVSPRNFQSQMDWLVRNGYRTITMAQLNSHLKSQKPLPAKPMVITFDDGWIDGYTVAFPMLNRNGLAGTFFVYTQPIDRSPVFLSWKQIEEMSAAGMDFQGHTISHPHLTRLARDQAIREITEPKRILESRLNRTVVSFAYPFGEYNSQVIELVRQAGYDSAVTIDPGYRQRSDRIYQLQRIRISYRDTLADFESKLPK